MKDRDDDRDRPHGLTRELIQQWPSVRSARKRARETSREAAQGAPPPGAASEERGRVGAQDPAPRYVAGAGGANAPSTSPPADRPGGKRRGRTALAIVLAAAALTALGYELRAAAAAATAGPPPESAPAARGAGRRP